MNEVEDTENTADEENDQHQPGCNCSECEEQPILGEG